MAKPLIIVESPAKAKTISKYLNNKYIVKASMGHIRDLPKKEIGVDIEKNFTPKYVVDTAKKKIISELKKDAAEADAIYLASDHDREGEAIAWHLAVALDKEIAKKPLYRIVFNEITQKSIKEAMDNPGSIDIKKVDAQQARRILDRIVGYKISPLLWKLINPTLSAGRVQSVALRLICERDDEIKAFVPEEYWSIEGEFWKAKLPHFKAELHSFDGKKIKLENKEQTDAILNELAEKQSNISSYKQSERLVQPPPPYITSTLQQDASRIISFNAKKTMLVAQKLYEGLDVGGEHLGLITYMRTDSVRISDEANESVREFITRDLGKEKVVKTLRVYKNKNAAQDAHEAIRPTYPWRTPESLKSSLTPDLYKLYDLIWKRFVATQMIPIKLSTVAMEITCGKGLFKTSGSVMLVKGFFEIYPHVSVSTGEDIHPDYRIDDHLEHSPIAGKQHFTKPPAPYTEAQLIKELESLGIGRPSTYASITNTIVERKYVDIREKKFFPTELGHAVNKFLVAKFDSLFNVTFTAEMESKLDDIEYGKQEWQQLLSEYYEAIMKLYDDVDIKQSKKELTTETDIVCDKCGKPMVIKMSKNGQFLACSGYPTCKNAMNIKKDDTGKISTTEAQKTDTDIKCDKCGSDMVIKRTRTGKEFLACSGYPKCKNGSDFTRDETGKVVAVEKKSIEENCPECGSPLAYKKGRFGEFVGCSGYPICKYIKKADLNVKCPTCGEGDIVAKKSPRFGTFYSCSRYPDCKHAGKHKPVNQACPSCGNPYIEEHRSKDGDTTLVCPKCKN
jgi:DNA topoisomerase-1